MKDLDYIVDLENSDTFTETENSAVTSPTMVKSFSPSSPSLGSFPISVATFTSLSLMVSTTTSVPMATTTAVVVTTPPVMFEEVSFPAHGEDPVSGGFIISPGAPTVTSRRATTIYGVPVITPTTPLAFTEGPITDSPVLPLTIPPFIVAPSEAYPVSVISLLNWTLDRLILA